MNQSAKKIAFFHDMLDAARILKSEKDLTVEMLREYLGTSRTTADKYFSELSSERDGGIIMNRKGRNLYIDGNKAYFLGISIGSTRTRVVLLDLNFEQISHAQIEERFGISLRCMMNLENLTYCNEKSTEFGYVYETPQGAEFSKLKDGISELVSVFLNRAVELGNKKFPLMAVGFAVSGPVDYLSKKWCYAPRLPVVDGDIISLIGFKNYNIAVNQLGLYLSIDNNAKAAMISEYQYLLERECGRYANDVALIYIGRGVSSAVILENKLLRGSNNLSGELGHVNLLLSQEKGCSFVRSVEYLLAEKSEESCNPYLTYLPHVINMMNCILGIDRFLLVGHSDEDYETLGSELMAERFHFTVPTTRRYCEKEDGRNDPNTDAIGAAIEAYYCLCQSGGSENDRVNLAYNIVWKTR